MKADLEALADPELLERWAKLADLRERVLAEIEPLRKDKQLGTSLQAKVVLTPAADEIEFLRRYEKQLPMLFIVSEVELAQQAAGAAAARPTASPRSRSRGRAV